MGKRDHDFAGNPFAVKNSAVDDFVSLDVYARAGGRADSARCSRCDRTRLSDTLGVALTEMSAEDFAQRYRDMQRYVGWTDDDARLVASLGPLVAPHADALVKDFYREIERTPDAAKVITGGSEQIKRLSATLREWIAQLVGGAYDEAYMARRWKVGLRHVEIGLAQRYTSLALSRLRAGISQRVWTTWEGSDDDLAAALASLNKLLDIDHALIQDAYEFEYVRRERQSERERSERKFRHLVESASCLIMILNAKCEAVYFNPFAEQATGCRADEIRRDRDRALKVLGREREDAARRLAKTLADGNPTTYESQIEPSSAAPRWIHWTLTRITDFDDGDAILAVGHDVTEQRRSAEQALQASRLATIGEMYARLAHESRNALQRLRVCTEMLTDQFADHPTAAGLLERSQRAQDDLRRLLDEVRSFAAPIALECTECRLAGLWREAWSLLQQARKDRGATLLDEPCDASLAAVVDRFRMVQAFRNIFENSLAACGNPAAIHVRCREIDLEGERGIEIVIDDNGPGFDEGALNNAFEPFYTTKSSGTGLGLAIVRRVVEAHGGQVSASSASPHGARLRLFLPTKPQSPR